MKKLTLKQKIDVAVFASRGYFEFLLVGFGGELLYQGGVYIKHLNSGFEWIALILCSSVYLFVFLVNLVEVFVRHGRK